MEVTVNPSAYENVSDMFDSITSVAALTTMCHERAAHALIAVAVTLTSKTHVRTQTKGTPKPTSSISLGLYI